MSNTPRTDGILRWIIFACKTHDQLDAMAEHACELERENAALREQAEFGAGVLMEAAKYKAENAALRADRDRLDWLAVSDHWFDEPATESFTPKTFRAAIDAAMKEAKP